MCIRDRLRAALGSSPCRQPRPARRRRCPAAHCPSGRRGLIPPFTNPPKCSAKPLFERGFLCVFNGLNIRTVEDQFYLVTVEPGWKTRNRRRGIPRYVEHANAATQRQHRIKVTEAVQTPPYNFRVPQQNASVH